VSSAGEHRTLTRRVADRVDHRTTPFGARRGRRENWLAPPAFGRWTGVAAGTSWKIRLGIERTKPVVVATSENRKAARFGEAGKGGSLMMRVSPARLGQPAGKRPRRMSLAPPFGEGSPVRKKRCKITGSYLQGPQRQP